MKNNSIETYRFQMENFPILCTDIVFFNSEHNKVLLFRRKNKPQQGVYYTVGGHVLKNEDLTKAVVRITELETGITVEESKLIFGGVISEKHDTSIFEGVSYNGVTVYYGYIISDDEKINLNSENDDYKWFSVDDDSLHPYIKERVANLIKVLKGI